MRERGFANHCMGHCFCNDKYSYLICGITKWIFKEKSHLYFRTTTTTAKLLSEPSSFRTLYHEWRVNPFWSPLRFIYLFIFNWGKIALQIVLISAIHQHQSDICIRIPLPRDFSLYACRVFYLFIHCHIMASGPITSWQIDGKQWK